MMSVIDNVNILLFANDGRFKAFCQSKFIILEALFVISHYVNRQLLITLPLSKCVVMYRGDNVKK